MYVDGCRVLVVFVAGCWRARLVSMDLVTFWLLTWYLSLGLGFKCASNGNKSTIPH